MCDEKDNRISDENIKKKKKKKNKEKVKKMKFRKTKTQLKETRQMVPHNSNKIFRRKVTMKTGQKGKNIIQRLN